MNIHVCNANVHGRSYGDSGMRDLCYVPVIYSMCRRSAVHVAIKRRQYNYSIPLNLFRICSSDCLHTFVTWADVLS